MRKIYLSDVVSLCGVGYSTPLGVYIAQTHDRDVSTKDWSVYEAVKFAAMETVSGFTKINENVDCGDLNVSFRLDGEYKGLPVKGYVVDKMMFGMKWEEDSVPDYVEYACQFMMNILQSDEMYVFAVVGGMEIKIYKIESDEDVADEIIDKVKDFWSRINRGDEYEPDYGKDYDLIKRMQKVTDGKAIQATNRINDLIIEKFDNDSKISELEKKKKEIDGEIRHLCGDAASVYPVVGSDGSVVGKPLIKFTKVVVDEKVTKGYDFIKMTVSKSNR